jgi:hypothetical protein
LREEEEGDLALSCGARCQRGGEGSGRTGSGEGKWAAGQKSGWAETFPLGPFIYFSFFLLFPFLVFPISFIDFAN